jgi:hypothetical protein
LDTQNPQESVTLVTVCCGFEVERSCDLLNWMIQNKQ